MNFGTWIGIVAFSISLYVLWQIRQLLLLIFTAIVIATSLNTLVQRLCHRGLRRSYAVLLSMISLVGVLTGFFLIIIPPFIAQFQQLALLFPQGIEILRKLIDLLLSRLDPELISYLPDIDQFNEQLQPIINQLLGRGLNFFYGSFGALLSLLLLLVLALMLLSDPIPYRKGFIRLFPAFYRRRVDRILKLCNEALQGWLVGILFNMCVIAILSFISLLVLKIPLALAQAVLAGILTFIPNIGPMLSVIPPMAIAIIDNPLKSLAVLITYIIIQQVESNILTPLIMARQVSLLPAFTLLAQVFFTTFFGFLGLFLALPLAVVGQIWFEEVVIRDILDNWGSKVINEQ